MFYSLSAITTWTCCRQESGHRTGTTMTTSVAATVIAMGDNIFIFDFHYPNFWAVSLRWRGLSPNQLALLEFFHLRIVLTSALAAIIASDSHFSSGILVSFQLFFGQSPARRHQAPSQTLSSLDNQDIDTSPANHRRLHLLH